MTMTTKHLLTRMSAQLRCPPKERRAPLFLEDAFCRWWYRNPSPGTAVLIYVPPLQRDGSNITYDMPPSTMAASSPRSHTF
jgi:hypothetical protein